MSNSIEKKKVSNPTFMKHISPKNFNEVHDVPTHFAEQDWAGKETKMQILFNDISHWSLASKIINTEKN